MVQPNKNVPNVNAMCNIKGNGANNPIVAPTLLLMHHNSRGYKDFL